MCSSILLHSVKSLEPHSGQEDSLISSIRSILLGFFLNQPIWPKRPPFFFGAQGAPDRLSGGGFSPACIVLNGILPTQTLNRRFLPLAAYFLLPVETIFAQVLFGSSIHLPGRRGYQLHIDTRYLFHRALERLIIANEPAYFFL
jgi:hypothetical protein